MVALKTLKKLKIGMLILFWDLINKDNIILKKFAFKIKKKMMVGRLLWKKGIYAQKK